VRAFFWSLLLVVSGLSILSSFIVFMDSAFNDDFGFCFFVIAVLFVGCFLFLGAGGIYDFFSLSFSFLGFFLFLLLWVGG
ncbi:hypothetical protein, partial [Salmonella enterica]|uniref:hypothetical protein n=1 Tax=Salmonella enterica TaxID=28901 RepID=UPI0020C4D3B0